MLCHVNPQVPSLRAALNLFSAQLVSVLGVDLTQLQDLAFGLVELHEVGTDAPPEPVKVPLDVTLSLQHVSCTKQFGVGKLAEGALNPTVHAADKDVEQHYWQYQSLRNATHHSSPLTTTQSSSQFLIYQTIHP